MKKNISSIVCNLTSMDVKEIDDEIWFAACNRNGLYCIDATTYEIKDKVVFEDEPLSDIMLFHDMLVIKNNLILCPHNSTKAVIYNMSTHCTRYIELSVPYTQDTLKPQGNINHKFAGIIRGKDSVYFLGYSSLEIYKLDINTFTVDKVNLSSNEFSVTNWSEYGAFSMGKAYIDDRVVLPIGSECKLVEMDFASDSIRIIKPEISLSGIGGITVNGKTAWIVGRGKVANVLVRWDLDTNTFDEIQIPCNPKCDAPFYPPIVFEGKIFLIPLYESEVFTYFDDQKMMSKNEELSRLTMKGYLEKDIGVHAFSPRIHDRKLKFICGENAKWVEYDLDNDIVSSYYVTDSSDVKDVIQDYIKINFNRKGLIQEGNSSLGDYLNYILNNK